MRAGNFRQAEPFCENPELDAAFENFRQRLYPCLVAIVTGRHAITDIEIGDKVDRKPQDLPVPLPFIGKCTDGISACAVPVSQLRGFKLTIRIIEIAQTAVSQKFVRPGALNIEPALGGIVGKGHGFAEIVIGEEIVGCETLMKLAKGTGQRGLAGCALSVREKQRTVAVANVH